jgi:hypothetical protein
VLESDFCVSGFLLSGLVVADELAVAAGEVSAAALVLEALEATVVAPPDDLGCADAAPANTSHTENPKNITFQNRIFTLGSLRDAQNVRL